MWWQEQQLVSQLSFRQLPKNISRAKICFFAHILLYALTVGLFLFYCAHFYYEVYSSPISHAEEEFGGYSRHIAQLPAFFWPCVFLFISWGTGLFLHFLTTFVFSPRSIPNGPRPDSPISSNSDSPEIRPIGDINQSQEGHGSWPRPPQM